MMLRLFKIQPKKGEPIYYDSKRAAKHERNKRREIGEDVSVLRGPDHRKGETFPQ